MTATDVDVLLPRVHQSLQETGRRPIGGDDGEGREPSVVLQPPRHQQVGETGEVIGVVVG